MRDVGTALTSRAHWSFGTLNFVVRDSVHQHFELVRKYLGSTEDGTGQVTVSFYITDAVFRALQTATETGFNRNLVVPLSFFVSLQRPYLT